ncbi:MAG: hypothetical protein ACTHOO_06340 [Alcanivorax sp.]
MSNFTKSIVYSTTVLAAGVVGIFAIYNVASTPPGSNVAEISPAAGTSSIGIDYSAAVEKAQDAKDSVIEAGVATSEAIGEAVEDAKEMGADMTESISADIEDAKDAITEATETPVNEEAPVEKVKEIAPEKHGSLNYRKGSSGPHFLPERTASTSKYFQLTGNSAPSAQPNIGNIDDIITQAIDDAERNAKSSNSKSYGGKKFNKKKLLSAIKNNGVKNGNDSKKKKKKPMTQQAFIMQQAMDAAMKKSSGGSKKATTLEDGIMKASATDAMSQSLMGGSANALFGEMTDAQIQQAIQAAADAQDTADAAATAAAAAVQAASDAQDVADQSAAVASASQTAADQALADWQNAQAAETQAQSDLTNAQNAETQAQTDLANAQAAQSQAQTDLTNAQNAESQAQTDYQNADNAATAAEAAAAGNPSDPVLQQAAIDARAAADAELADYQAAQANTSSAQSDLSSAQAAETQAQTDLANAQAAETQAQSDLTAAQAAEASASTTYAAADTQAQADAAAAQADQNYADQLDNAANQAVQYASDAQSVADNTSNAVTAAQNNAANAPALETATGGIGSITAQAQATTAAIPEMQPGTLLDSAIQSAETAVASSAGSITGAAVTAASGAVPQLNTIIQSATNPEAAKAAARGFLEGQLSSAIGGGGLTSLTSGLLGSFAGALGGDITTGVIVQQVIQAVVALPTEIIPIIPSIPFVGDAISGLLNVAGNLLSQGLSGPIAAVIDFSSNVVGAVGGSGFGDNSVMQSAQNLIDSGGNPGGVMNIVTGAVTSTVASSQ